MLEKFMNDQTGLSKDSKLKKLSGKLCFVLCASFLGTDAQTTHPQFEDWSFDEKGNLHTPAGQQIKPWDHPQELKHARKLGPDAVQALLNNSVVRISQFDNGDLTLHLHGRLKGGMMGAPQAAQRFAPLVDKTLYKVGRLLAPMGAGIAGALGIESSRRALQNSDRLPNFDLMDKLNPPREEPHAPPMSQTQARPREKAKVIERPIATPQTKPASRAVPFPQSKPVSQTTNSSRPVEEHKTNPRNLYERPIKKDPQGRRATDRRPLMADFRLDFDRPEMGLAQELERTYTTWQCQQKLKETLQKARQAEQEWVARARQALHLDRALPQKIENLVGVQPFLESIALLHDDIASHPEVLMTQHPKNAQPWARTPKVRQSITSPYVYKNEKGDVVDKMHSIWEWVYRDVSWYAGERPKLPKKLNDTEKSLLVQHWRGSNLQSLGLIDSKDLIQISDIKRFGSAGGRVFQIQLDANVLPRQAVTSEVLEILDYMAETNSSFGSSPYVWAHNIKGQVGLFYPKRGLVYPIFREDRALSDAFLPRGYDYPAAEIELGKWLLERYQDAKVALHDALIAPSNDRIREILADPQHRSNKAIDGSFGRALNAMGPKGVRGISRQAESAHPEAYPVLNDLADWLFMFRNPKKYVTPSMVRPIAQYKREALNHSNVPASIIEQWKHIPEFGPVLDSLAGTPSLQDQRNSLCYPLCADDYLLPHAMLPEGYGPQEGHEPLGSIFIQVAGNHAVESLEHILGIPALYSNAQADNPHMAMITTGLALDTMARNGELPKAMQKVARSGVPELAQATQNAMDVIDWVTHQEGFNAFDGDRMHQFITYGIVGETQIESYPREDGNQALKLITPVLDKGEIRNRIILTQITHEDVAFAKRANIPGGMRASKNGFEDGVRWFDEKGDRSIRIMNGNPEADHECQREDYVKVVRDGQMRDVNGGVVRAWDEGFEFPRDNPRSHIKKTEWHTWAHPLHPTDPTVVIKK